MADSYSRETDDYKSKERRTERDSAGSRNVATMAMPVQMTYYSSTMLGSSGMGGRGNAPAHNLVMQSAQQTHGNRAVQRSVQRMVLVQRCGDIPCGCSNEERIQHALNEHGSDMPPVAREADLPFMPLQRWSEYSSFNIQRASTPTSPPTPADPNYTRTKGGDAYVGPGDGAGIGGLVSYGCYCGPGGDPITGSRCGPNAAPKDDIDAKCMRHDSDYNKAGVDSGSTPGTVNMFTDLQGWLKSEQADRRLADTVDAEMDAHPGSYSPSAMLYGQGIKGIFGGRANISHAMNWGMNKGSEAEKGLEGAYDDASKWGSNKADEAEKGVSGFMKSAAGWSSAGDVASGLLGGASDAANWLGKSGGEALGGATKALGSAGSWLGSTIGSAAEGVGEAALGMGKWGLETTGALGNVGLDLAGRGARAVGGAVSDAASAVGGAVGDAASWGVGKVKGAWDTVSSWF